MMTFYNAVWLVLGNLWLATMLARLPALVYETPLFYRAVKQHQYKGRAWWFVTRRVVVPGLLGAPVVLWMDTVTFFRRLPAAVIWEAAGALIDEYGPEEEEYASAVQVDDPTAPPELKVIDAADAPPAFRPFHKMLRDD